MAKQETINQWLKIANKDLESAKILMKNMYPAPFEIICYHCQQATEKFLKTISISFGMEKDVNAEKLAQRIIDLGILTNKSYDDCLHIAIAILADCNYIASWNFKHLVNVKTINGVRAITNLSGFNPIDIVTPEMLLKENEDG